MKGLGEKYLALLWTKGQSEKYLPDRASGEVLEAAVAGAVRV